MFHALLENKLAFHAHLAGRGRGLPRMIRLHGALRNDHIRIIRGGIRQQEFKLTGLRGQ